MAINSSIKGSASGTPGINDITETIPSLFETTMKLGLAESVFICQIMIRPEMRCTNRSTSHWLCNINPDVETISRGGLKNYSDPIKSGKKQVYTAREILNASKSWSCEEATGNKNPLKNLAKQVDGIDRIYDPLQLSQTWWNVLRCPFRWRRQ